MATYFDRTKYIVVEGPAGLTVSGLPEIVAAFEFKKDGERWARLMHGPRWRKTYTVLRKNPRS
jgi:hypothetical protein